ncbi:MAG: hypothetical protein QG620_244 [Patescibacteria group bacterium]|nr:hypothetical protein [Patescibacteria group bacterium]
MKKKLYIIAHNIRSAHNVGSVFRTADGAGVDRIYLTGYTQAPFDEKKSAYPAQAQKMLAKTALGAEEAVSWERVENIGDLILGLRKDGVQIVALENGMPSVDYRKFKPSFPCALILGTEVTGIDEEVLGECDSVISIPMRGQKESLNVSVAAGIAMYEILK